jgi:S-adenosylmethionine decarboxylase
LQPTVSHSSQPLKTSPISGLHIVSNFSVPDATALMRFDSFKTFINALIERHHLCKVGEVYHQFEHGGYTAVICLTESHLSVHTWPENNYVTFDVFLSNYMKDNRNVTQRLYEDVKAFFRADIFFEQFIDR